MEPAIAGASFAPSAIALAAHRGAPERRARPSTSELNWVNAEDRAIAEPRPFEDNPNRLLTDEDLGRLQWTTIQYYLHESNPDNGLVRDKTHPRTPASIAAMGLALTTMPVLVERGVIIREYVAKIARKKLRFLYDCPQGREVDASGYKGFYYHFLDMDTGRRAWRCVVHHGFGISVRRRARCGHLF